jgi:protein SCO1/2
MTSSPELQPAPPAGAPSRIRRGLWAGIGAGTAAAAGVSLWGGMGADAQPRPQVRTGRIPDVPVVTHDGLRVRFHSDLLRDRVVLVSMMYAQCNDRCPPMTQNLKRVHRMLGDRAGRDVFIYSISLLPEFDRPADLRAYRQLHDIGPGWTFLTGTRDDVEQIRVGMGFFDPDPKLDADLGQHIGMVRIGNDALNRWCMAPILAEPNIILEGLMAVDPVSRAAGRRWARPVES